MGDVEIEEFRKVGKSLHSKNVVRFGVEIEESERVGNFVKLQ